jgi:hypothetical protein
MFGWFCSWFGEGMAYKYGSSPDPIKSEDWKNKTNRAIPANFGVTLKRVQKSAVPDDERKNVDNIKEQQKDTFAK